MEEAEVEEEVEEEAEGEEEVEEVGALDLLNEPRRDFEEPWERWIIKDTVLTNRWSVRTNSRATYLLHYRSIACNQMHTRHLRQCTSKCHSPILDSGILSSFPQGVVVLHFAIG